MKKWPKEGIVSFEALVNPLAEILRERPEVIEYDGYDIGDRDKACVPSPDEDLSPEGLKYHAERGRDLIDVVLGNVFRLGMEQGRRDYKEREGKFLQSEIRYLKAMLSVTESSAPHRSPKTTRKRRKTK